MTLKLSLTEQEAWAVEAHSKSMKIFSKDKKVTVIVTVKFGRDPNSFGLEGLCDGR